MVNRLVAALAAGLIVVSAMPAPAVAKETPLLKVQDKGALKGASQVAIAAFNVGFIFESVDRTATTGGMIGAFGGTTNARSELTGVTPAMMQQIADAAYADFVSQLTARGIAAVTPATAFADPNLARLKGDAGPIDINIALEKGSKGKATFYRPQALPRQIMLAGDFVGSGMSSMGLQMAAGQNSGTVAAYAKASGTPVVDVVYLIDFSQQKRPGAFSFGGLKVNASLAVVSGYSKMSVIGANGRQNLVTVNQPVSVEGEFIQMSDATSGASKAGQAAANVGGAVLGALTGIGGLNFGKSRKFSFAALPGKYEEGAIKAASLANQQLADQLAAQR